jgi:hypothetical protein
MRRRNIIAAATRERERRGGLDSLLTDGFHWFKKWEIMGGGAWIGGKSLSLKWMTKFNRLTPSHHLMRWGGWEGGRER